MITILSGSARKNSNTLKIAKAIKIRIQKTSSEEVCIINFEEYDLPPFNGTSIKKDNLTKWQKLLVENVSQSTLVIVVSPEYNWFPSAEIIQYVHTFGSRNFTELWENKVFAFVGVSSGRGGRIPTIQLSYLFNKMINVLHVESMVSAKMFESQFTQEVIDEEGNSKGNIQYDDGLNAFVDYSLAMQSKFCR